MRCGRSTHAVLVRRPHQPTITLLCTNSRIEVYEAGPVVEEGQDATLFLVLMDGEIVVSKLSGDRNIEAGHTSHMREHFPMAVHMLQCMWGDHEGIHLPCNWSSIDPGALKYSVYVHF